CRFLTSHLRAGQVVVDVGANVGCIAFLAARLVGPTGAVITVEPNPDNVQLLYAGAVVNGCANVRVLPCAASRARGARSVKGGASNPDLCPPRRPQEGAVYAQSIVLDQELADLERVDLIKLDIEGHEPLALEGAADLIRRHRPVLLTEFNPRCLEGNEGIAPLAYAEQLLALYRSLWVTTAFGDGAEFRSAPELMEFWQRRNAHVSRQGLLPPGMLTFDIVATNEPLEAPASRHRPG